MASDEGVNPETNRNVVLVKEKYTLLHTNFRFLGPFYKVLHKVVEEKAAFLSGLQEMEVAIMTTAIVMDTPTLFGPCQSVRPQKTD